MQQLASSLRYNATAFMPGIVDKYRKPPNDLAIIIFCAWRALRQMFATHAWGTLVSDLLGLLGVGAILGALFGPDESWVTEARKLPIQFFIATLAVALCCCLRGLGTFGNERPAFWRERNSGVSTFAYFIGKSITDLMWVYAYPAAFLLSWSIVGHPRGDERVYFEIFVAIAWASSGQGYLLSVLFKPEKVSERTNWRNDGGSG